MGQILSRQARADKKIRDEKYMREVYGPKKASNQRRRRADIKAGKNIKGLDWDHKDKRYEKPAENRAGTKNE